MNRKPAGAGPRYVCVHGHFYQPPRENAWLETIEPQESAAPYHDWNRRIAAECYAPNAGARVLDESGRIVRLVNNYARISFNFGPTLLDWLALREPDVYRTILDADRDSAIRFSGHGSALAQAYNHSILPLCNARDLETQVLWGLSNFRKHFGRAPEGMWLPETAVDLSVLEALARHGLRFTILAPSQAAAWRAPGESAWRKIDEHSLETRRPYRVRLDSGAEIAVFFYDGAISRGIAFERLLNRGDRFATRLLEAAARPLPAPHDDAPPIAHCATDGETYGHHHRFGDMALAWTLEHIDGGAAAQLTNYGEYLARYPPRFEVRIHERSAWSCAHGLGRWSADCGCRIGDEPTWRQHWRGPLRAALDALRDELAALYERRAAPLLGDPWGARDRYEPVAFARSTEVAAEFLRAEARRPLDEAERREALGLLELQRHAMLMYTSCGWFFDELSGIETEQVLQYACRAVELAVEFDGGDLERRFVASLRAVPGNRREFPTAAALWERRVRPARVDAAHVAADHVAASLFDGAAGRAEGGAFRVRELERHLAHGSGARLVVGRIEVTSLRTLTREELVHGFLHLGDDALLGAVRRSDGAAIDASSLRAAARAVTSGEIAAARAALASALGAPTFDLATLSRDTQREILATILADRVREIADELERLYGRHAELVGRLEALGTPAPRLLHDTADLVLVTRLARVLESPEPDVARLRAAIEAARAGGVKLDREELGYAAARALEEWLAGWSRDAQDPSPLVRLAEWVPVARGMAPRANVARAQERFCRTVRRERPAIAARAAAGDAAAASWIVHCDRLGEALGVDSAAVAADVPLRGSR